MANLISATSIWRRNSFLRLQKVLNHESSALTSMFMASIVGCSAGSAKAEILWNKCLTKNGDLVARFFLHDVTIYLIPDGCKLSLDHLVLQKVNCCLIQFLIFYSGNIARKSLSNMARILFYLCSMLECLSINIISTCSFHIWQMPCIFWYSRLLFSSLYHSTCSRFFFPHPSTVCFVDVTQ